MEVIYVNLQNNKIFINIKQQILTHDFSRGKATQNERVNVLTVFSFYENGCALDPILSHD